MNKNNETFRKLTLKCTRQPIRYQYNVVAGFLSHQIKSPEKTETITSPSITESENQQSVIVRQTFNNRDFFGTCFNCGYRAHSQNFCPLKECHVCKKWGHADRVCYHRKNSNIRNIININTNSDCCVAD